MTKLLFSLSLAAVLVSSAACDVVNVAAQTQTGTFERTLQVKGPVSLVVTTGSGNIQIRTGSGQTVHVIGRISARGRALDADGKLVPGGIGAESKSALARIEEIVRAGVK